MPPTAGEEVAKTIYSGFITEGPKVSEFEKLFGFWLGNPIVASCNSCTSAITLSLATEGVGNGDEVITTPYSCMATNSPIVNLGAKIVWADIDPSTGNIDPLSIAEKITSKTKAILYVHWAGQPADISNILKVAHNHGIPVIEDAAHALGAQYMGQKIGNHSDYVCFSFQAIKHITTGDGGMVAFNGPKAKERYERLCRLRWFGLDRKFNRSVTKWETDISNVGYKMHMNDIVATIGIEQMKHINTVTSAHISNALYYDKEFQNLKGVELIRRSNDTVNAAWIYSLMLSSSEKRESFAKHMIENGIACNVVHVRNDKYSCFKQFKCDLPGVDRFSSRMINIPCGWWLTEKEISKIVDTVRQWSLRE